MDEHDDDVLFEPNSEYDRIEEQRKRVYQQILAHDGERVPRELWREWWLVHRDLWKQHIRVSEEMIASCNSLERAYGDWDDEAREELRKDRQRFERHLVDGMRSLEMTEQHLLEWDDDTMPPAA
jgi:hypothetical protein